VADQDALDGRLGAIFRVKPNGRTTVVSSGRKFQAPSGIAVEKSGKILVADPHAFPPGHQGGVIRVNPTNGNQTVVSKDGMFKHPRGVTVAPTGAILVADEHAFNQRGGVIRVNPKTGKQTEVSSGAPFINPLGIARASTGRIFIGDETAPGAPTGAGTGGVFKVNPTTGSATKVASGGNLNTVSGVAVLASGNVLVANQNGLQGDQGGIVLVNSQTGAQRVVSSGRSFQDPVDLVVIPA
jgi:glucose/arabinose dehydrogenase